MEKADHAHLPGEQGVGAFRPRHAAHGHGDAAIHDGVGKGVDGAQLKGICTGVHDDQDAEKADEQDNRAGRLKTLTQDEYRKGGGPEGRGKVDGNGACERHQAESHDGEGLGHGLRQAAPDMRRRNLRPEHAKPGLRKHDQQTNDHAGR